MARKANGDRWHHYQPIRASVMGFRGRLNRRVFDTGPGVEPPTYYTVHAHCVNRKRIYGTLRPSIWN